MRTFSRTLSFLDAEERRTLGPFTLGISTLLVLWGLWLTLSKATVYAVSEEGRLLAAGAATPIQSPVAGVIAETSLALGAQVKAGDVLVMLDVSGERLRRDEEEARRGGLVVAVESLQAIIEAERSLAVASVQAGTTRVRSAAARAAVATETASLVKMQSDAIKKLQEASLVSGLEVLKAAEDTQRERGQATIVNAETSLATADLAKAQRETVVRLLGLERDLADLRTRIAASNAIIAQIDWEISRRTLRSPVDGTVADVLAVPKGSTVGAQEVLATVVPRAKMRWVAYFPPRDAVGRIRPGQRARIRLDAFPWTAYGALDANVDSVGSEPRDRRIRVELNLGDSNPNVPLSHGMSGTTDVEVEELSPLRLLFRLSGQVLQGETSLLKTPAPRESADPVLAP